MTSKFDLFASSNARVNPPTISNPNFSIVAPGGCNARCKFCFWKEGETVENYESVLKDTMESLPAQFSQLSITGGEPTLSPKLKSILGLIDKKKFPKIVMTTNGSNLSNVFPDISGIVDHLNISRHSWDDEVNDKVFKVEGPQGLQVPTTDELKDLCDRANDLGIDVTLSAVLLSHFKSKDDVYRMIEYTKSVGATALFLRKPHGTLDSTKLEESFSHIKTFYSSECPVCRTNAQLIRGLRVSWKRSVLEPSKVLGETVYEAVFNSDGRLTSDWAAEDEIEFQNEVKAKKETKEDKDEKKPRKKKKSVAGPQEDIDIDDVAERYLRRAERTQEQRRRARSSLWRSSTTESSGCGSYGGGGCG